MKQSIILASILVLAVALLALSAPASIVYGESRGPLLLNFTVEKQVLKLYVYPDGAVEPVVEVEAAAKPSRPLGVNLSLDLYYALVFREDIYSETFSVRASGSNLKPPVPGPSSGASTSLGNASVKASFKGVLRLDGDGGLVITGNGTLYYTNRTGETVSLAIDRLVIEKKGGIVTLYLKASTNTSIDVKGNYSDPREFFEKLRKAGIDFLRLEKVVAGFEADRTVLEAEISVDLDGMINYAISKGFPPSDAEKIRSLIVDLPYKVEGWFNASLEGFVSRNGFFFNLELRDEYRGDVLEAYNAFNENSDVLQKFILTVVLGVNEDLQRLEKGSSGGQPLAPVIASTSMESPRLELKPPVDQEVKLVFNAGNETVYFRLSMQGGRYTYYPGTGDPARDAERTLMEIGDALVKLRSLLGQVKAMLLFVGVSAPGLEKLVPGEAVVEAAGPGVAVSKTRVSIDQLGSIRVEIEEATTTTTTTTTTATSQPSGTSTETSGPASTTTTREAPEPGATSASPSNTAGQVSPGTGQAPTGVPQELAIAGVVVIVVIAAVVVLVARRR